ncbi:DEAD/DEAH box helicase [Pirellulaceae bacterium]|jgi:SNF2 family DNA or RNA helicase|nr:DEAD/DEAH box helicase [Pirellulaceae bacterium]
MKPEKSPTMPHNQPRQTAKELPFQGAGPLLIEFSESLTRFDGFQPDVESVSTDLEMRCCSWQDRSKPLNVQSFFFAPSPQWEENVGTLADNDDSPDPSRSPAQTQKDSSLRPKKRTRISPPEDVIRVQDRLFYLLQPPLESVLSGKNIRFKFQPFPYQFDGIAYLYPRHVAILADEMGLGKTMQAISAIRLLLHAREISNIVLICPKPLVTNWVREFGIWAPEIPVEIIMGDQSKRRIQWSNRSIPVKIANYELLLRDHKIIHEEDLHFDLVLLDEAQRIKNPNSSTSEVIKQIPRTRNWALTGTPIENSIDDLAGIFDFLSPGLISPGMQPRKITTEVAPFIIRRTKDEVLDDMPPKFINDVYLDLNDQQWEAYQRAENEGVIKLNQIGSELTVHHVFELILRLKQICNADPLTGKSTKLERLTADLEEVAASGQKAIIFSQWVKSIEAISEKIPEFRPLEYHGRVPSSKRDRLLKEFEQADDRPVILMSYGTGSVGLNLQFCRYVFLYDRWWNPAVEDQAINRAHRLGSKGSVTVNRFICSGTVEERIHHILKEKRELFQTVLGGTGHSPISLNQSEIFGLFNLETQSKKAA